MLCFKTQFLVHIVTLCLMSWPLMISSCLLIGNYLIVPTFWSSKPKHTWQQFSCRIFCLVSLLRNLTVLTKCFTVLYIFELTFIILKWIILWKIKTLIVGKFHYFCNLIMKYILNWTNLSQKLLWKSTIVEKCVDNWT